MGEITVVIPTFNRSRLVQRAIESVLGQTHRAKEIIVVDDGSTDDTARIVEKYGDAIHYIYQVNAGVSAARNHGIRFAKHEWTAFLDSDDYWTPNHLERIAAAIQGTEKRARFYFTDLGYPEGSKHATLWAKIRFKASEAFVFEQDATGWMLAQRQPSAIQCSVFCTDMLKSCGGFDRRFTVMEDTEIFCRLGVGGAACAVNTIGCIQTSDDDNNNRLTGKVHSHGESYWEHDRMLWKLLLSRFTNLKSSDVQAIRHNLAVAHWRLARLQWRSGRFAESTKNFMQSAMARPEFFLQLLRKTGYAGDEKRIVDPHGAA